jgi:hypothetical protein
MKYICKATDHVWSDGQIDVDWIMESPVLAALDLPTVKTCPKHEAHEAEDRAGQ